MIRKSKSLFYIPGLGSGRTLALQRGYTSLLNFLRIGDIVFFDPLWETDESFESKLKRLTNDYETAGKPSKVWGISAGASLAVQLAGKFTDDIEEVHLVSGKARGSGKIGQYYIDRAPTIKKSVEASEAVIRSGQLKGIEISSYIPKNVKSDGVVDTEDMVLHDGMPVIYYPRLIKSHGASIVYALLRHLPFVA